MNPTRREEIEALIHAARERGPAALSDAPEDLRREVESLLAQESADSDDPDATQTGTIFPAIGLRQQLGPYRIEAAIGEGGMGQVFRASDTRLHRTVAIKTCFAQFTERFQREARAVAALNHSHIATLYDVGSAPGGFAYLVLEYVEGPTLADLIKKGPIEPVECRRIALQIAEAIEAAHERGIVHRDLKPANIKLGKSGEVKVLDFGLAKAVNSANGNRQPGGTTVVGTILGTPAYMSPEQALGGDADLRSDIWSYGVVVYELLTGKRLFTGSTPSEILSAIVRAEPDLSAVPPRWLPLLHRCLTKDVRRRLQSIGEARVTLEDGLPEPVVGDDTTTTQPKRWLLPVAALVGALAMAGAGYFLMSTGSDQWRNPLQDARFTRVTDFEGAELEAEVSPDGRFIAFLSDRDGPFDIFLTQPGTGRFSNLTQAKYGQLLEPTRSTGFSGDGTQIWLRGAALSEQPGQAAVRLMPILGGPPRPLVLAVAVSWSPDGNQIVYHQGDGDPIFVADKNAGNARQIFRDPIPGGHCHYPVWSRDGKWIYFVRGNPTTQEMDLWRIAPTGGSPERMTNRNVNMAYPAPISDTAVLYVSPADDGSGPWLYEFDLNTRESHRISYGLEQYTSVAASADGRRLVATVANPRTGLWSIPVQDAMVREADVKRVAVPSVRALAPRFTGSSLFYLSSLGAGDGLWRLANGEAQEIWKGADNPLFEAPAFSPDGSRIAILLRHEGHVRLNLINADGTAPKEIAPSIDIRGSISWSPDGQSIAAGGVGPDGPGLFKVPAAGGPPQQIGKGVSTDAVWAPDGSLIAFTGPPLGRYRRLMAVRPDGTPYLLPEITLALQAGERFRFTPDAKALVYIDGTLRLQNLRRLDLATKQSRLLTQFDSRSAMRTFDFTPDGKQIVFDRTFENSDIVLIDLAQQKP